MLIREKKWRRLNLVMMQWRIFISLRKKLNTAVRTIERGDEEASVLKDESRAVKWASPYGLARSVQKIIGLEP